MTRAIGVIGLGAMGSMALWQLARRGLDVVGFEQFPLGHANGGYSGETRMFRTAYSNGTQWVPALVAARALWRTLEEESGLDLLDLNGFASIGRPGTEKLERLIACAGQAGLAVEVLAAAQARTRFPALAVGDDEVAVFDAAGGLVKAERAVMAALEQAKAHGARIQARCPVTGIEPRGDRVAVHTSEGSFAFRSVVVTAGAWASAFLPDGLVEPHRVALHWYLSRRPELFRPRAFPPHIRYVDGRSICLFSSQDDTLVKAAVGGSLGVLDDPAAARDAEPWERPLLSDTIARHYPDLWPEPVRSESYVDGFTPDGDAVIGALPGSPNVLVAAGFSAHGFKVAPVIGAALADLAQTGGTALPLDHLRLDRYAEARSAWSAPAVRPAPAARSLAS